MKEGARRQEVMMSCPDFEPGTPHVPTTGPIDANHKTLDYRTAVIATIACTYNVL